MSASVLLVEGDVMIGALLVEVLQREGYQVQWAEDCEQALELLACALFDVVIIDVQLQAGNGFQVVHAARASVAAPAVIVQSAQAGIETVIEALRASAHDYLLKPYRPEFLLERLHVALSQRALGAPRWLSLSQERMPALPSEMPRVERALSREPHVGLLQVGALQIDRLRHVVSFDGVLLQVTQTEYRLLCCLAEADSGVVEGGVIVQRTHGYHVDNNEAQLLLKPHIRNLRRKIDPRYLINIRGFGYRLAQPEDAYAMS